MRLVCGIMALSAYCEEWLWVPGPRPRSLWKSLRARCQSRNLEEAERLGAWRGGMMRMPTAHSHVVTSLDSWPTL